MPQTPGSLGTLGATDLTREPRESELPVCPICADTMIAAEAGAVIGENTIRYLWTCDNCSYGFVSSHVRRPYICH
ncbi:MAG: hypothetical protein EPO23_02610 [Xanthobacteraceae bacterium]|nr:MAG: hypothetical protein EPO23_02610 [Xanthobacteraceae bacterium]